MSPLPAINATLAYNAQAAERGWPSYCDATLAFDSAELVDMLEIWRAAAGTRAMPLRSDLTARLLKSHMPHIAIYERIKSEASRTRYRVRLMGTAFAQVYGDLSGKIVDDVVPAAMVPRFHYANNEVLDARLPLRFVSRVDMQNKSYFVAEYAMLPLMDDEGTPAMVLSRAHFATTRSWNDVARDIAAGRVPTLKN
ncbi:MAG TPA: PAS domain-containing protein [Rhizomicrobium sp.]|jgi:hypothetical protein|nr:PAS domain-containing protein [Rhizomicrobium sp.]